ncbi:hypothetical protein DL93DRAFT_2075409 [Clavulina sp. PMI_390]|nr:hypothetical protein DL93DRAFT_2075409 [Clavulina sp. PMI_390]
MPHLPCPKICFGVLVSSSTFSPLNFVYMYTSQKHDVTSIPHYQRVSLHFIKSYRY